MTAGAVVSYWLLPGPMGAPPLQPNRTPGTSSLCTWPSSKPWEKCGAAAAGELRANYGAYPWALCRRHMSPHFHDRAVREFLVRWRNGVS